MSKDKQIKPDGGNCSGRDCPHYETVTDFCTMTGLKISMDLASKDKLFSSHPCKPWVEMQARDYSRMVADEKEAYDDRRGIERQIKMHEENIEEKTVEIKYAKEELKKLQKK